MKELVERILQLDVLKGMGVTFRTQNPKNIYTEQYPLERPMIAERYRGAPRLNNHPETGETLCIVTWVSSERRNTKNPEAPFLMAVWGKSRQFLWTSTSSLMFTN